MDKMVNIPEEDDEMIITTEAEYDMNAEEGDNSFSNRIVIL